MWKLCIYLGLFTRETIRTGLYKLAVNVYDPKTNWTVSCINMCSTSPTCQAWAAASIIVNLFGIMQYMVFKTFDMETKTKQKKTLNIEMMDSV